MSALRLKASDPAYKRLDTLATLLAHAINPHLLFTYTSELPDIETKLELDSMISEIKSDMAHWIEAGSGAFANFIFDMTLDEDPPYAETS